MDSWSHNDWGVAFAGEAGEACNKLKKLRRGDFPSNRFTREMIADEIADTVIYADLLCERLGVSLEEAIVRKFNEVSESAGIRYQALGGIPLRTLYFMLVVEIYVWRISNHAPKNIFGHKFVRHTARDVMYRCGNLKEAREYMLLNTRTEEQIERDEKELINSILGIES